MLATAPKGHCLFVTLEDGIADTIRPRLEALGGDPDRVDVITGFRQQGRVEPLVLNTDTLPAIENTIQDTETKLLTFDPLSAYLGPNVNSWKDSEVRSILDPLAWLAEKTGIAVVGIMHLNKDEQRSVLLRIAGSMAFSAAPRCIFGVIRDPHDPEPDFNKRRRLMAWCKMNIGPFPAALAYRLEPDSSAPEKSPCMVWDEKPLPGVTLQTLLDENGRGEGDRGSGPAAVDAFMRETLAEGPEGARDVEDMGRRTASRRSRYAPPGSDSTWSPSTWAASPARVGGTGGFPALPASLHRRPAARTRFSTHPLRCPTKVPEGILGAS
jgi:putative DNA primase/helicase